MQVFFSLILSLISPSTLFAISLLGLSIGQRSGLGNRHDQLYDGDVLQYDHLLGCLLLSHVIQWSSFGIALERL